jgi:hypothetical protein
MQKAFDFKFNPISQIPNEFKSKIISQKSVYFQIFIERYLQTLS